MTNSEFRIFIKDWITLVDPNIRLIRRDESGNKPRLPYVDYVVGTRTQMGGANRGAVDNTGESKVTIHKDAIVSLRGHGDASEDILSQIERSLNLNKVLEHFSTNCVGIRGVQLSTTEIPTLLEQTFERQYLYEPVFGYAEEETENVGVIETVEIDPTLNLPS